LTRYFSRLLLGVLVLLAVPILVSAKEPVTFALTEPVDISADSVEFNRKESTFIAKGKVELKEGTKTLSADHVEYNEESKDVRAEGNVVFQDGEDMIRAERMTFNLLTKEGTIDKGNLFLKKQNFYILGDEIQKTGESTYVITRGEFTTCGWDRPAWKFTARDVNVTMEGYATTKNAVFRILDQPVFYLPWGMFPVMRERQSGLLLPELIFSSSDGVKLSESFFWAISREQDATISLQWIQERGWKPGLEYRYAFTEDLKGTWYGEIIDDMKYNHTRYRIEGEHDQQIWKGLSLKSKIDYVSDKDYLIDFGQTALERSENSVRSTLFAEQSLKKSLLTAETTYFKNLLQKDNDTTLQYLPFISFFTEYIPLFKERLYGDVTSDLVNFERTEGDTYSRMTVEPTLRLPYQLRGFNFLASGSYIGKLYSINQETPNQNETKTFNTFKFAGDANVPLARYYHAELFDIGMMQSVIKPRLQYTFIPNNHVALPTIDPSDLVVETNTITYSFNHYLNALSKQGAREVSLLEVEQTYSLSGDLPASSLYSGSGHRFSDVHARLTMVPTTTLAFSNESFIDVHGEGFRTVRNTFTYTQPSVWNTSIAHSYTKDATNEILWHVGGKYRDFEGRMEIRYSIKDSDWIDTLYSITYQPKCWSFTVTLTQSRRPNDTSVKIHFGLPGFTSKSGGII
jgi:LPS-assembly protein